MPSAIRDFPFAIRHFLRYHSDAMKSQPVITLSTSQALFTLAILFFFFTALNGYILNLVGGFRANAWVVLLGVLIELAAIILFARPRVIVERNALELAGFLVTVIGVWIYFVAASLPTLLPPTQSEDAVRVYLQALYTFPEGKLVSWYPAAGTFFVAMLSHWLGWQPLRVLHPTAALFVALSAGAVYGMTCEILPRKSISKILALVAPAFLFVPWSYFAGIIDWEQYFFAQVFAQLFILAALWYTMSYARQPRTLFAALVGVALLGTVMAYPIFVGLPFGLFALVVLAHSLPSLLGRGKGRVVSSLTTLLILIALLLLAALALDRGGILELATARISASGDVGVGGVANPSLDSFGGAIFLLLALIGIPQAWRANSSGKVLIALLLVWVLQYAALVTLQPILKISGYRVDKTFYILVFPLAILAALTLARVLSRFELPQRALAASWVGAVVALIAFVAIFRPPINFSSFTESELQAAQWAQKNLDTYEISYLDPLTIRAYWLALGIWGETLPNEYYQWIPAGVKLGPRTFDEWRNDPSWSPYILVRDVSSVRGDSLRVVHQIGASAILARRADVIKPTAPAHVSRWHYESTLHLIGYDLPRDRLAPGDTLTFATVTESIYPPAATVRWRALLVDTRERVVSQMERDPFDNKYPVQRWSSGKGARDEWTLPIPLDAAPGAYELRLGLFARDSGEWVSAWPILPEGLGKPVYTVPLAKIKIPISPPSAAELGAAKSLNARLGENFSLVSYTLNVDRSTRRVHLTLYWQSISKTQADYTVFVHLLDASDKIIAQIDREPVNASYPTSIWDAQEIIKDEFDLEIPASASGKLKLELGMYSQPSLKRLPVGDSDKLVLDVP